MHVIFIFYMVVTFGSNSSFENGDVPLTGFKLSTITDVINKLIFCYTNECLNSAL